MAYANLTPEERRAKQREIARRWRQNNPDAAKAAVKNWRTKNKDKYREKQNEWRRANPIAAETRRVRTYYRKVYKITLEDWNAMFAVQDHRCGICRADKPGGRGHWHTDHCHSTGVVRGILCSRCNHMLGHGRDNPAVLRAGATYLEKHHGRERREARPEFTPDAGAD